MIVGLKRKELNHPYSYVYPIQACIINKQATRAKTPLATAPRARMRLESNERG
jgi:hypothetical protein